MVGNEVVCLTFTPISFNSLSLGTMDACVQEMNIYTHMLICIILRVVGLWSAVHLKATRTHTNTFRHMHLFLIGGRCGQTVVAVSCAQLAASAARLLTRANIHKHLVKTVTAGGRLSRCFLLSQWPKKTLYSTLFWSLMVPPPDWLREQNKTQSVNLLSLSLHCCWRHHLHR